MIFFLFFSNFEVQSLEIHGDGLDRGMTAHRLAACTIKLSPQELRSTETALLAGDSAALPALPVAPDLACRSGRSFFSPRADADATTIAERGQQKRSGW